MIDTEEYYGGTYPSPDDPPEVELGEVKVVCTVITYLDIPKDLEDFKDKEKYIRENYDLYNNLSKNYIFDSVDVIDIDEIER